MPTGPAARILDPVLHVIPGVLQPGPGAVTVLIGGRPAWRGLPLAAVGALVGAKAASEARVTAAQVTTAGTTGTPAYGPAKAAEETLKAAESAQMSSMIAGASGGADLHACVSAIPIPLPPPHGLGVVIDGSPTVLINTLPACRLGDTILEAFGPPDKILMGQFNVIIGNSAHVVTTGLGWDVDIIVNKSPTMIANLQALKGKVDIEWGPPGGGSEYDADALPRGKIRIDPAEMNDPVAVAQSLAHESGHALYKSEPYVPPDGLTKSEFVDRNVNRDLKDEGEATLTNAQVRNEILENGGPDIGIAGANSEKYAEIAEKYPDPADRDKARQEIADVFADNEEPSGDENDGKTYRQYYGEFYEQEYDRANPPPSTP